MTTFTLDTSGEVLVQRASSGGPFAFHWSDLDAFTQGAFEEAARQAVAAGMAPEAVAFRNWSSEALAAIRADCVLGSAFFLADLEEFGATWWRDRQAGLYAGRNFPPLTVSLGDDGKVRLSTIERAEAGR